MFGRIVGVVGIGLVVIFAIDVLFLRKRAPNRPSLFWEIAPVLGFIGAILVGLAFVEALRREVVEAWRWGLGLGLVLAFIAAALWWMRVSIPSGIAESGWRAWVRAAQTYGIGLLVGVLAVVIAVRVVGALLEVFIASALGVLTMSLALGILLAYRRRGSVNPKQ